jgi:hypothetical protein
MRVHEGRGRDVVSVMVEGGSAKQVGGATASAVTSELRIFLVNAKLYPYPPGPEGLEAALVEEGAPTANDLQHLNDDNLDDIIQKLLTGGAEEVKPIREWLVSVKASLEQYAEAFEEYGYEDTEVLMGATEEDFAEAVGKLGVKKPHRRLLVRAMTRCWPWKLKKAIAKLKAKLEGESQGQRKASLIDEPANNELHEELELMQQEEQTKLFNELVDERCGLLSLVARETDAGSCHERKIYRFPHLTFQEFFASEHMIAEIEEALEGKTGEEAHEVFKEKLGVGNESKLYDVWYREIVLFITCGLSDEAFGKLVDFLLDTDDGIGAVQTRVYQMLKERGMLDSEKGEVRERAGAIIERISKFRTTEFMASALMHPAKDLRELALTELREYSMDGMAIARSILETVKREDTSNFVKAAGLHSIGLLDYAAEKESIVRELVAVWMDAKGAGYAASVKEAAGTAVATLKAHTSQTVRACLCERLRSGEREPAEEAMEIIESFKMTETEARGGDSDGADVVEATMELMATSPWVASSIAALDWSAIALKRMDRIYADDPRNALTLLGAFVGEPGFAEGEEGYEYAAKKVALHLRPEKVSGAETEGGQSARKTAMEMATGMIDGSSEIREALV